MNLFHWNPEIVDIKTKAALPKVIQLTDPHIFKTEQGCLLGLNTRHSLAAVLADIRTNHLDADLILATGDISQDHSSESYQHFAEQMDSLGIPVAWIPGNHDTNDQMVNNLIGNNIITNKRITIGDWEIVLLDSSVENAVYGCLGAKQLAFLQQALETTQCSYVVPVLHHHPVDVGCEWMEPIGLHDAEDFWPVVEQSDLVKAVLWGHIHQDFDQQRGGIRLLATPSTSVQFKPGSSNFSAGHESPGYRSLQLQNDGQIQSQVYRIEHIEFTVDYTVKGY